MNGWIALGLTGVAAALGWYTVRTRDGRPPAEHLRPYRPPPLAVYAASVARRARERAERAMKADRAWANWSSDIYCGLTVAGRDCMLIDGHDGQCVPSAMTAVERAPDLPIYQEVAAEVGDGTRLVTRWQAAVACYQLGGPLDTLCAEFDVELQRLAEGVAA